MYITKIKKQKIVLVTQKQHGTDYYYRRNLTEEKVARIPHSTE